MFNNAHRLIQALFLGVAVSVAIAAVGGFAGLAIPGVLKAPVAEAAPAGFRLPFVGFHYITNGPRCGPTHGGVDAGVDYTRSAEAIDFGLSFGENVYAAETGTVQTISEANSAGFGNLIKIQHSNGLVSYYAHLSEFKVTAGTVAKGALIAVSGNSGNSTAAHLHFEVRDSTNYSTSIRDLPGITWYTSPNPPPCQPSGQYDGYAVGDAISATATATMTNPSPGSTLSGSSVTFSWTAGSGASGYGVWIGSTPSSYDLADSGWLNGLSYTASGLPTNGGAIHVSLWSYIDGSWRANYYTYRAASQAPTYWVSLSASATSVSAGSNVTLTASSNIDVGPTPYYIQIVQNGSLVASCGFGTTCTYAANSVSATTRTFVARISGSDGSNSQAQSSSVNVTWGSASPPNAPSPVATATSTSVISVSWAAISGADQYLISNGTTNIAYPTSSPYLVSGLQAGTRYCFWMKAHNSAGWSLNWSNASCATTSTPVAIPSTPGNIQSVPVSSSQIRVSWNDVSNETSFKLTNGVTTLTLGANTTNYTWGGLAPNTYMCFAVQALNSAGGSAWTGWACTRTPTSVVQVPGTPGNVQALALNSSQIRVTWNDVSNETSYKINDSISTVTLGQNITSYTVGGLAPGTFRCFVIQAVNAAGSSSWSSMACATTPNPRPTVTVDDQSSGFVRGGPSSYWYQAPAGYNSHMWWTYVRQSGVQNWGKWTPSLTGAGYYEVYVFIPSNYATTGNAGYRIHHNGVDNVRRPINQNAYYNQWISLGTYYFNDASDEYVFMGDETFETSGSRMIGFDAMQFVPR